MLFSPKYKCIFHHGSNIQSKMVQGTSSPGGFWIALQNSLRGGSVSLYQWLGKSRILFNYMLKMTKVERGTL